MKNVLKIFVITFYAIAFNSCGVDSNNSDAKLASELFNNSIELKLLKNPEFEPNFDINLYTDIFTESEIFKSKSKPFLKEILKKNIPENLVGFVIHFKDLNSVEIENENIEGINLYYTDDNYLKNKYFQKSELDFIEKFNMFEGRMSYTNLLQITQIYSENKLSTLDFKLVYDNSIQYDEIKTKSDFPAFYAKLKYLNTVHDLRNETNLSRVSENSLNRDYDEGSCQYIGICEGNSSGECPFLSFACTSGHCEFREEDIIDSSIEDISLYENGDVLLNEILNNGESNIFNTNEATQRLIGDDTLRHNFKSLLHNSEKGRKYIDFYYALSASLDKTEFNTIVGISILKMLPTTDLKIKSFLSDETSPREIILDIDFGNKVESILKTLKNNVSDTNSKALLDDLINDLNSYKGLSKQMLLNEISD